MPATSLRGPQLAVLLLIAVLAGGTIGYMLIEGWNTWDAFYMTVTTVASQEDVLTKAGIHRARGLIAAVGTDAENVFTVLTARVMRPDLFIIARVESDDAEHKLRRAGADRVISPYQIGATHMVQTALRPAVAGLARLATTSKTRGLSIAQGHIG